MALKKATASVDSIRKKKDEATVEFSGFREIQLQAYYNYLKRINDNIPGNELSDWLEAEKIIRIKTKAS